MKEKRNYLTKIFNVLIKREDIFYLLLFFPNFKKIFNYLIDILKILCYNTKTNRKVRFKRCTNHDRKDYHWSDGWGNDVENDDLYNYKLYHENKNSN